MTKNVLLAASVALLAFVTAAWETSSAGPAASALPNKRFVIMLAGDSAGPPTPIPTPTPPKATPTQSPTPAPTSPPTATPTPIPAPLTFGAGTYLVGSQISARTYRTRTIPDGCYWERLSGLSGDLDDIITNDFTNGVSVVTLQSSDVAFNSSRCGTWTTDLSPITASAVAPVSIEGTLIVGVDIAPGVWKAPGGNGCYWERLSGFSGDLDDIIANDFTSGGQVIVQISPSDKGFSHHGCGTWAR